MSLFGHVEDPLVFAKLCKELDRARRCSDYEPSG